MSYEFYVRALVYDDTGHLVVNRKVRFSGTSPGDLVIDFEGFLCELEEDI